jgi:hypothetical protein
MKTAYILRSGIYNAEDVLIKRPSILLDGGYDIFIGWGEEPDMQLRLAATHSLYRIYGCTNPLAVIELTAMPIEETLYIIRRGMGPIDADFAREIFNRHKDSDMEEWLTREMQQVPVSLD